MTHSLESRPRWLYACGKISIVFLLATFAFLLATFASYALQDRSPLAMPLFRFGLGGENNVGAWWAGMLPLLGAVLAFDGYANRTNTLRERRGWLALAGALLLLSFDEVASLHEYLAGRGRLYLVPLGLLGLTLVGSALVDLRAARVPRRTLVLLVTAFGLLATVPLHEIVQHVVSWNGGAVYGLRAVLEEGTEILAMLLLLDATRSASAALARTGDVLTAVRHRTEWLFAGAALLPVLTAATFVLPYPGGPASWLGAALFLACALNVVRGYALGQQRPGYAPALLLAFYIVASAATAAVPLSWDPAILGHPVGLRGAAFALLLAAAGPLLKIAGRPASLAPFALGALGTGLAALRPQSQILWCAIPPAIALWLYAIETKAVAEPFPASEPPPEAEVPRAAIDQGVRG